MRVTLLLFVLRYAKLVRMTLSDYIKEQGRGGLTALARKIGAHAPDLSRWAAGDRPVPVERCVAIEAATGGAVSRIDLKPVDWQQIWPELKNKKEAA
ncbi:YdaS family helix-turn-helix protein [Comamonas sp. JNW]|uniref:transcriptional regulator n=1 Tax=Comamonas sp. JNW TaxID=2170731 RepID=UPI001FAEC4D1|nr:YdaS family helix-turn-helix protein [Comamonas sp. JNW]